MIKEIKDLKADIVAAASEHLNDVQVSISQGIHESMNDVFIIIVRGFMWAEEYKDTEILKVEHFADWKQAIKARWFPEWLQRKYPVKHTRYTIASQVVYPDFRKLGATSLDLRKEYIVGTQWISEESLLHHESRDVTAMIVKDIQRLKLASLSITISYPSHWTQWLLQAAKETWLALLLRGVAVAKTRRVFGTEGVMGNVKPRLREESVLRVFASEVVEVERVGGVEV